MSGCYFDELALGRIFDHDTRRTVTETDNILFSTITHNTSPLHLDEEYMKESEFGTRIVNSCLTLSLMIGISVLDTTHGTSIANLGWDEVRLPRPVYPGDTLRIQSEVIAIRESRSRPDAGVVTFEHRAYNQHNDLVASCKRPALMLKRAVSDNQSNANL